MTCSCHDVQAKAIGLRRREASTGLFIQAGPEGSACFRFPNGAARRGG